MNSDKEFCVALERYFLGTFLQNLSALSSKKESDIRKYIYASLYVDRSTLNNFLAGRSHSLRIGKWPELPKKDFKHKSEIMDNGKGPRDYIDKFNSVVLLRYFYLPFCYAMNDKSEAAECFNKAASWSIEVINGMWDGKVDVTYWSKVIELFPLRLLVDIKFFTSPLYEEDIVRQMISELELRTTVIKDIPRKMLREFVQLETFVDKYSKKKSVKTGTSHDLIQKLKEQDTSLIRMIQFARGSLLFRCHSIRAVDIQLYSLIYCLPKEEQLKAQAAIGDIHGICAKKGIKPRKPDLLDE
ncbi:MAG: hypothetical protein HDT37_05880 [Clostridiales bacterium]|nr:hypothetical protein [Clostridiales bacterium]